MTRRLLYLLALLFMTANCFGFEALVRATGHYRDNISTAGFTSDQLDEWNARTQKGDIIAIFPDGHIWGRLECLPDYVVVKIPTVPYSETIAHYCDTLNEAGTGKLKKRRKFRVPDNVVDGWVSAGNSAVTITSKKVTNFINNIIEKTK